MKRTLAILALVLGAAVVVVAWADPPPWAPAHGWRRKHDPPPPQAPPVPAQPCIDACNSAYQACWDAAHRKARDEFSRCLTITDLALRDSCIQKERDQLFADLAACLTAETACKQGCK